MMNMHQSLSVEFDLSVWEGRRLMRKLPRQRNVLLDAGLDLVPFNAWARLCHAAVVGTGASSDLTAAGGPSILGALTVTGAVITTGNNFFLPGMAGQTLIFDLPDDHGRVSWRINTVDTPTQVHLLAAPGIFPIPVYTPPLAAPTSVYVITNTRVTLDAAVKLAVTDSIGNSTALVANLLPAGIGWGSIGTWVHQFSFSVEVAPVTYHEIGWLPFSAFLITSQLFGRAIIAGGVTLLAGQHLVAVVALNVNFWPTRLYPASDFNFTAGRYICGSNMVRVNPNGSYDTAAFVSPDDGWQWWLEPYTLKQNQADTTKRAWITMAPAGTWSPGGGTYLVPAGTVPPAGYTVDTKPNGVAYLPFGFQLTVTMLPRVPATWTSPLQMALVDPLDTDHATKNLCEVFNVTDPTFPPGLGEGQSGSFLVNNLTFNWDRILGSIP
jgi:hypothetical protein